VVWIWMGDSSSADASRLPEQPWLTAGDWETSKGYIPLVKHKRGVSVGHLG